MLAGERAAAAVETVRRGSRQRNLCRARMTKTTHLVTVLKFNRIELDFAMAGRAACGPMRSEQHAADSQKRVRIMIFEISTVGNSREFRTDDSS